MPDLARLIVGVQSVIKDTSFTIPALVYQLNNAVTSIATGIRMPDRTTSPPLPDLYSMDTVSTDLVNPYVILPDTYLRKVFYVADDIQMRIAPPKGGGYYDFLLFLNQVTDKDLSQTGSLYLCCVKGLKLYYQGRPSVSKDLTIHFGRKPVDMAIDQALYHQNTISFDSATGKILDSANGFGSFDTDGGVVVQGSKLNDRYYTVSAVDGGGASITVNEGVEAETAGNTISVAQSDDAPDGIPEQFQMNLLKHYICKEIYGQNIEAGNDFEQAGEKYHKGKFFEYMTNMVDFIGPEDAEPVYYGYSDYSQGVGVWR